jgi:hypothetical protein
MIFLRQASSAAKPVVLSAAVLAESGSRWSDCSRTAPANQLVDAIGDSKVSTIQSFNCSFPKLPF